MFGQKKKKAQFNMMGDSRVTCYDFIRRFDELFESYRAADYKLYHRLSEEERDEEELFPWDFIDIGVTKQFMLREWKRAKEAVVTPNCKQQCSGCGASRFGGGICYANKN